MAPILDSDDEELESIDLLPSATASSETATNLGSDDRDGSLLKVKIEHVENRESAGQEETTLDKSDTLKTRVATMSRHESQQLSTSASIEGDTESEIKKLKRKIEWLSERMDGVEDDNSECSLKKKHASWRKSIEDDLEAKRKAHKKLIDRQFNLHAKSRTNQSTNLEKKVEEFEIKMQAMDEMVLENERRVTAVVERPEAITQEAKEMRELGQQLTKDVGEMDERLIEHEQDWTTRMTALEVSVQQRTEEAIVCRLEKENQELKELVKSLQAQIEGSMSKRLKKLESFQSGFLKNLTNMGENDE